MKLRDKENKLSKLKAAVDKEIKLIKDRDAFEIFLLNGPTFSKRQLDSISRNRKAMNQLRTKSS